MEYKLQLERNKNGRSYYFKQVDPLNTTGNGCYCTLFSHEREEDRRFLKGGVVGSQRPTEDLRGDEKTYRGK